MRQRLNNSVHRKVSRPFMIRQSIASEASAASSRMNLHIRRAKVYTQDMLKSEHNTC